MDQDAHRVDLETRLTYQEAALQELNDVIVRQQKILDNLGAQLELVRRQMHAQAQFDVLPTAQEPPPPHY
jgi:SlyX protein